MVSALDQLLHHVSTVLSNFFQVLIVGTCSLIGHLHGNVILLQLPVSFTLFFFQLNLSGVAQFK